MRAVFDALARAAGYCLHPRLMLWSLGPLLLGGTALALLGWLYWEAAVDGTRAVLDGWSLLQALLGWLDRMGLQGLRSVLAPLIVVALMVPLVVLVTLLLVALLMTPAIVRRVVARRFPQLEARHGAGWLHCLGRTLAAASLALVVVVLSVPLWLVPPLVLVLPPLVWGWLTQRVLAFDVLARHASAEERRMLLQRHRLPLLAMGVVCGFIAATPSLIWALGAMALVLAPLLALVSLWLYTLVFAFAAAWFAHFLLAELQGLRNSVPMTQKDDVIEVARSLPAPS